MLVCQSQEARERETNNKHTYLRTLCVNTIMYTPIFNAYLLSTYLSPIIYPPDSTRGRMSLGLSELGLSCVYAAQFEVWKDPGIVA